MAYVAKGDKDFEAGAAAAPKSHKIRITLTSRNVKALEKGKSPCLGPRTNGRENRGAQMARREGARELTAKAFRRRGRSRGPTSATRSIALRMQPSVDQGSAVSCLHSGRRRRSVSTGWKRAALGAVSSLDIPRASRTREPFEGQHLGGNGVS